jgi:DNA polymerase III subunit delta'
MTRIFGHDAHFAAFAKAVASGRLHHGWIFSGPRGVGKASFAIEAARILVDPDNRYASMVDNGSHPDIIRVRRLPKEAPKEGEAADPDAELKRSIAIDQIREVQQRLTTRPSMAEKRVVSIWSGEGPMPCSNRSKNRRWAPISCWSAMRATGCCQQSARAAR